MRGLRLSVRALSAQRVRAGLAVAGTAIGVAGVVVLTAIGEGAREAVVRRIEGLGRNMLVVTAATIEPRAGRPRQGSGRVVSLRPDDAAAIVEGTRAVVRAAPAQDRDMSAKYGPMSTPATVLGTTPDWLTIRDFELIGGRFFTHHENAARARVAVLGAEVRGNLFPDSVDPVGRTVRIGRVPFEVIGVLAPKGVSVDGSATEDDRILVPLETALHRLFAVDYLKMIYLEAASAAVMDAAEAEAAAILRVRHDVPVGEPDDFTIQNQRVLLEAELAARAGFRRLITGLGFLSLLVGGVGILSIMLLSVRERRPEIGLRVAVGARRSDILLQFLAEALVMAGAGGVFGMVLGTAIIAIVSSTTALEVRVSAATLARAVASAAAIGLCSGVLPARRAAALDPVDALEAEP